MDLRQGRRRDHVRRARRCGRRSRRSRSDPRARVHGVSAGRIRVRPLPHDAHRRTRRAAAQDDRYEVSAHDAAVSRCAPSSRGDRAARRLGRARGGAQPHVARRGPRRDRRDRARAPARDPGPRRGNLPAADRRKELLSNEWKGDPRAHRAGRTCHSEPRRRRATHRASAREIPRSARDDTQGGTMSATDPYRVADEAIEGVRARGDAFVREQIEKFDRVKIGAILIAPREVAIDPEMAKAIDLAIERVESFHREQLPRGYTWRLDGTEVTHRVRPLKRVGLYVPGGRAVSLSTLIMTAVPARIAGVRELVVITTPAAASRDELHYACARLGVREIYQCGGAAGIAAAALG